MKKTELLIGGALLLAVCLLTVLYGAVLLPVLRRLRAGQMILKIGPSWHIGKEGTPTMGGISFITAILTAFLVLALVLLWQGESGGLVPFVLVLLFAMLCGIVGFVDDYSKLVKKQNEGLSPWQKYLLLLLSAALFLFGARALGLIGTAIDLPFSDGTLELGIFYYPLALLFLTGLVNALNLTDGLDGLLSSTVAILSAFLLLYGIRVGESAFVLFGPLMLGMTLGFLVYNHHPAKMFMGDTGSLFLGGLVAGLGIISARPLTVLGGGGVFLIEAVSVILQVGYFKLTHGKRLFRMAPLHHHFEKCGFSENAVVGIFSLAAVLFAVLAYLGG